MLRQSNILVGGRGVFIDNRPTLPIISRYLSAGLAQVELIEVHMCGVEYATNGLESVDQLTRGPAFKSQTIG